MDQASLWTSMRCSQQLRSTGSQAKRKMSMSCCLRCLVWILWRMPSARLTDLTRRAISSRYLNLNCRPSRLQGLVRNASHLRVAIASHLLSELSPRTDGLVELRCKCFKQQLIEWSKMLAEDAHLILARLLELRRQVKAVHQF